VQAAKNNMKRFKETSGTNLIPLRGWLFGAQLAAHPVSPRRHGLGSVLFLDQMIPLERGISLAADVYTPTVAGR
jgi:hypothetical protein